MGIILLGNHLKSNVKGLSDHERVAADAALPDIEGGDLVFGSRDSETITSLHPNDYNLPELPALIANKIAMSALVG